MSIPVDVQTVQPCTIPSFWKYLHATSVSVASSLFINNTSGGSGGGLCLADGGALTLVNSTITGNVAMRFGGGIMLGSAGGSSTCALHMASGVFRNNSALSTGHQLYFGCSGDALVQAVTFDLSAVGSPQVVAPLAGNITFADNSSFQCPPGWSFVDQFSGLYGTGSYVAPSAFCGPKSSTGVLVSSLSFACDPCGFGSFSLSGGSSNGVPGQSTQFLCAPCPRGASCGNGSVVSSPGYWSSVYDHGRQLAPIFCPAGYCCGGVAAPCQSFQTCAGNRMGTLCGDCLPEFSAPILSAACVPTDQCDKDASFVWLILALVALSYAFIYGIFLSSFLSDRIPAAPWSRLFVHFLQVRSPARVFRCIHATCANYCAEFAVSYAGCSWLPSWSLGKTRTVKLSRVSLECTLVTKVDLAYASNETCQHGRK
jgi:hypothetical protein